MHVSHTFTGLSGAPLYFTSFEAVLLKRNKHIRKIKEVTTQKACCAHTITAVNGSVKAGLLGLTEACHLIKRGRLKQTYIKKMKQNWLKMLGAESVAKY